MKTIMSQHIPLPDRGLLHLLLDLCSTRRTTRLLSDQCSDLHRRSLYHYYDTFTKGTWQTEWQISSEVSYLWLSWKGTTQRHRKGERFLSFVSGNRWTFDTESMKCLKERDSSRPIVGESSLNTMRRLERGSWRKRRYDTWCRPTLREGSQSVTGTIFPTRTGCFGGIVG